MARDWRKQAPVPHQGCLESWRRSSNGRSAVELQSNGSRTWVECRSCDQRLGVRLGQRHVYAGGATLHFPAHCACVHGCPAAEITLHDPLTSPGGLDADWNGWHRPAGMLMATVVVVVAENVFAKFIPRQSSPNRRRTADESQNQWCKQDQILKTNTKTKTTGSTQRHLADLTFK